MMLVARGDFHGYLHLDVDHWDVSAAHIILEAAGGLITDISSNPHDFKSWPHQERRSYVATNGYIHDQLIDKIKPK